MKPIAVVRAPSNLGLRPLRTGHEPGTWRAPAALSAAGLLERVVHHRVVDLERPPYSAEPQPGTRILNAPRLRAFCLDLARVVDDCRRAGEFPFVVGGDCSIVLGALAGIRARSDVSLVHVDGHSDFRHPRNDDANGGVVAAAGMDLALATGRGEAILSDWPGIGSPLVRDANVVQLGERQVRDSDWRWSDILDTEIALIDAYEAADLEAGAVLRRIEAVVAREPAWPF